MPGKMQKERCDTLTSLIERGCRSDFIENPQVGVTASNSQVNIQVTPEEVTVQLRPGLLIKEKCCLI